MTGTEEEQSLTLFFLNFSTRWRCVVNAMPQPHDRRIYMQYPLNRR